MEWISAVVEFIKGCFKFLQKSDNVELINQIHSLQDVIIKLKAENSSLIEVNKELNAKLDLQTDVVRHKLQYITRKSTPDIFYCAHCYDSENKLIQCSLNDNRGIITCPHCKHEAVYDKQKNETYQKNRKYVSFV